MAPVRPVGWRTATRGAGNRAANAESRVVRILPARERSEPRRAADGATDSHPQLLPACAASPAPVAIAPKPALTGRSPWHVRRRTPADAEREKRRVAVRRSCHVAAEPRLYTMKSRNAAVSCARCRRSSSSISRPWLRATLATRRRGCRATGDSAPIRLRSVRPSLCRAIAAPVRRPLWKTAPRWPRSAMPRNAGAVVGSSAFESKIAIARDALGSAPAGRSSSRSERMKNPWPSASCARSASGWGEASSCAERKYSPCRAPR